MRLSQHLHRAMVAGTVIAVCCTAGSEHGQDLTQDMSLHMKMTAVRPLRPGDQQRADAIVAAARKVMEQYSDYRKALASGYVIFLPGVKQRLYHFTWNGDFNHNAKIFDPEMPTALLYERTMVPGFRYKLVGVMYSAPYDASEDELDRRAPLSIARWHLHVSFCAPPLGQKPDDRPGAVFGRFDSIVTAADCRAAGGRFIPHISGWMLHVYASETDPAKIWNPSMWMEDVMDPGMFM